MKKAINLQNWNRREHFEFFKSFEEPFFGIVTDIDCTAAFNKCKENKISFFLYYMFHSIYAINQVEEFKYRIEGENIFCYDVVHPSSTIGRDDETFGYSFFEYRPLFEEFAELAKKEIEVVRNSQGLGLNDKASRLDVIHYSTIPWIKFSGLTHARNFKFKDSVPKVAFGKLYTENNRTKIPVSVNVHHGLADGLHVRKFLDLFQNAMDSNLEN